MIDKVAWYLQESERGQRLIRCVEVDLRSWKLVFLNERRAIMGASIFHMNLSIETISLYFCFEGLADQYPAVSTPQVLNVWNSTLPLYRKGLRELEERNIIRRIRSDGQHNDVYSVLNEDFWLIYN